jgi:hypothetical protein
MMEVADGVPKDHPAFGRVMGASVQFLRSSGVPPKLVTGHEWSYWLDSGGSNETWVPRRPPPAAAQARISPLGAGETRQLRRPGPDGAGRPGRRLDA